MTDLEGRELDAALARGLGWKVRAVARIKGKDESAYAYNVSRGAWAPVPGFHRSLDAQREHCGPWLLEDRARRERYQDWLETGAGMSTAKGLLIGEDAPLWSARAFLAAMVAELGERYWEVEA